MYVSLLLDNTQVFSTLCVTLSEVWDGLEVKLTFRRIFCEEMMIRWFELTSSIEGVQFSEEGIL